MTDSIQFEAWPKIGRLNRDVHITEKIDGTNAAIHIKPLQSDEKPSPNAIALVETDTDGCIAQVAAQSRTRLITVENDNHGFAKWVAANAAALADNLGEGVHFGEWWGSGIQRGYGLEKGEKRFSLFNAHRWADIEQTSGGLLHVVPTLYHGLWSQD